MSEWIAQNMLLAIAISFAVLGPPTAIVAVILGRRAYKRDRAAGIPPRNEL